MRFPLALCLALAAPALAADAPKPAAGSVPDMIATVMAKGRPKKIIDSLAMKLGFKAPVVSKAIALRAPDRATHGVYVIYDEKDGQATPTALVWARASLLHSLPVKVEGTAAKPVVEAAGPEGEPYIEAVDIRTDLSGKALGAVRSRGPKSNVAETAVSPKEPSIQADLKQEMKFMLSQYGAIK